MIEMPNVMLGRIFGAALIEQFPHPLLDGLAIVSLRHDVILMKDMAEEVTIVELVQKLRLDLRR